MDNQYIKVIQANKLLYLDDNKEHSLSLKPAHKIAYLWIHYEFNRLSEYYSTVRLTVDRIADNTGLSVSTVNRVLSHLKKAKVIDSISKKSKGMNEPTLYRNVVDITDSPKHKLSLIVSSFSKPSNGKTSKQWATYKYNQKIEIIKGEYFSEDVDMFERKLNKIIYNI